jgi:tellurite resistance protein TerC
LRFVTVNTRYAPLFIAFVFVELTDLRFAVDSIPAIFAVIQKPSLVYTSNVSTILGLRSLYILLADVVGRFHFLKFGLAVVLGFVELKMLLVDVFKIPIGISVAAIAPLLCGSVLASWIFPKSTSAHSPLKHPALTPAGPPRGSWP